MQMAPKFIDPSLRANEEKGWIGHPVNVSHGLAENMPSLQRGLASSDNFLKWDVVVVLIFTCTPLGGLLYLCESSVCFVLAPS